MDSVALREERAKLVGEARKIVDSADSEKRSLNGEENDRWEKIMADVDKLGEQVNTLEKSEATRSAEADLQKSYRKTAPQQITRQLPPVDTADAVRCWLARPSNRSYTAAQLENAANAGIDLNSRWLSLSISSRSMNVGSNPGQSFAILNDFGKSFEKLLKQYGPVLNAVRTIQTPNGNQISIPTVDDTGNSGAIVAEGGAIAVTPDPTTSNVTLGAFKFASKTVQVSLELLQDSIIPMEELLSDLLTERIARVVSAKVTNGAGTSEPFGLTVKAAASGTTIAGTAASNTNKFEDLMDLVASVDPAYRNAPGVGFMMADSMVWRYRKIKDAVAGQYIWNPSVIAGAPDRILGYPVYINQDMPLSSTIGAKCVLFGDFKKYYWREVNTVDLYRLDQLYIANGLVGFTVLYRGDGNLINVNAVKSLAAPAS